MSTTALITAEQFAQMHFAETEDYELVQGELIPLSSGTPKHAKIRNRLEWAVEITSINSWLAEFSAKSIAALRRTQCFARMSQYSSGFIPGISIPIGFPHLTRQISRSKFCPL